MRVHAVVSALFLVVFELTSNIGVQCSSVDWYRCGPNKACGYYGNWCLKVPTPVVERITPETCEGFKNKGNFNWTGYKDGKCFIEVAEEVTWDVAKSRCNCVQDPRSAFGGRGVIGKLAVLKTLEDFNFVAPNLQHLFVHVGLNLRPSYLGTTDTSIMTDRQNYVWLDGSDLDATVPFGGPEVQYTQRTSFRGAELDRQGCHYRFDLCDIPHPYLCEIEHEVTSTTDEYACASDLGADGESMCEFASNRGTQVRRESTEDGIIEIYSAQTQWNDPRSGQPAQFTSLAKGNNVCTLPIHFSCCRDPVSHDCFQ